MTKTIARVVAIVGVIVGSGAVPCHADLYDVPRVNLLEKRNYDVRSEGTLQLGYFALGAFSKYLAIGGTYTHSFSDFTAWELVNGMYTYELPSGLKNDLLVNFPDRATPDSFSVMNFTATTNLMFTPLYTKNLLFNSSIVHSQASLVAGGGVSGFTTAVVPTIDVGVVLRYFISKSSSLKFDFRDYIFLTGDQSIKNNLALIGGFAHNFGGSSKK